MNHLARETSPYLLQHLHNPVDWYPWSEEALARARSEQKPIFLSIGYAACHWCHVMERESFENEDIAAFLNAHFICIKVDREERPDLDEIYMTAVQILTGSGGWPMSLFLTPELKPFFGGTYFPPEDRGVYSGFTSLITGIAAAWEQRRQYLLDTAASLTKTIQEHVRQPELAGVVDEDQLLIEVCRQLQAAYDPADGGFGGPPKFPPSGAICFLLRRHRQSQDSSLLDIALFTLDKMVMGGIYDQLGGGFHRYSTDAKWLVPHFEKMLYDNALLAKVYLEAHQVSGKPLYRRVAVETLDYVLRELQDVAGGFHSSQDADSNGQEGVFYLWSHAEVTATLGEEEGGLACKYYGIKKQGNYHSHESYHQGLNILYTPNAPDVLAEKLGIAPEALDRRIMASRAKLLAVRGGRPRPGLDDKVLTSWNALMISALAKGYQVTGDVKYKDAAVGAGGFLLAHMMRDGCLLRSYRAGQARLPGFLDDYAFTIVAMLDLCESDFDLRWVDAADALARKMLEYFWDKDQGGLYTTAAGQANLIARSKQAQDGAEPSGNAMAAIGLIRLARLTDNAEYEDKARRILEVNQGAMTRYPQAFLWMLCAADMLGEPPSEIVIAGSLDSEEVRSLLAVVRGRFLPNVVLALADPSAPGARIPLLNGKTLVSGKPAAYVCRARTCQPPATTADELRRLLDSM